MSQKSIAQGKNLGSHMTTVLNPAQVNFEGQNQPDAAHYGNQMRIIKPVLPESPTKKIRSALKFSPKKKIREEASAGVDFDTPVDTKLSTLKGFGPNRTVSFDVDN